MRALFLSLLVALPSFGQDAVELRSGNVIAVDGQTILVEPGAAYLPPAVAIRTGKRLADCEAARPVLEAKQPPFKAIAVVVGVVVLAGIGGYAVGRLAR